MFDFSATKISVPTNLKHLQLKLRVEMYQKGMNFELRIVLNVFLMMAFTIASKLTIFLKSAHINVCWPHP